MTGDKVNGGVIFLQTPRQIKASNGTSYKEDEPHSIYSKTRFNSGESNNFDKSLENENTVEVAPFNDDIQTIYNNIVTPNG